MIRCSQCWKLVADADYERVTHMCRTCGQEAIWEGSVFDQHDRLIGWAVRTPIGYIAFGADMKPLKNNGMVPVFQTKGMAVWRVENA